MTATVEAPAPIEEETMPRGITARHARSCAKTRGGGRCTCWPSHQAQIADPATGKRVSKTFTGPDSEQAAIDWRAEKRLEIRKGTFRRARAITVRVALEELIEGMRNGTVRTRSGDEYKPSAIRGYEQAALSHINPNIGSRRIADVRPVDVERMVARWIRGQDGKVLSPSTIRNALMPLRVVYRRAIKREELTASPVAGIELPAVRGERQRIAPPEEAAKLVAATPADWRPVWATAIYAGLRLGELQALPIRNVDVATGRITVEDSWDVKAGRVAPKSRAGERRVPIPAVLRDVLVEHLMSLEWSSGYVFGVGPHEVFNRTVLYRESYAAQAAAELERLTPHDCRHTYASLMIAAGVNAKALSTYMGHANISITLDRYGHLMPGNEEEAAQLLDEYLARADTAVRKAAVEGG